MVQLCHNFHIVWTLQKKNPSLQACFALMCWINLCDTNVNHSPQGLACFCWHRRRASRSAFCSTVSSEASPPPEARLDCGHYCQVSSKKKTAFKTTLPDWTRKPELLRLLFKDWGWISAAGLFGWSVSVVLINNGYFHLAFGVILAVTFPAPMESIFVHQNPQQIDKLSWNPTMTDSCFFSPPLL